MVTLSKPTKLAHANLSLEPTLSTLNPMCLMRLHFSAQQTDNYELQVPDETGENGVPLATT